MHTSNTLNIYVFDLKPPNKKFLKKTKTGGMLDHLDRVLDQATSDCKGIIDRAMDITKLPTLDLRKQRWPNLCRTAINKKLLE